MRELIFLRVLRGYCKYSFPFSCSSPVLQLRGPISCQLASKPVVSCETFISLFLLLHYGRLADEKENGPCGGQRVFGVDLSPDERHPVQCLFAPTSQCKRAAWPRRRFVFIAPDTRSLVDKSSRRLGWITEFGRKMDWDEFILLTSSPPSNTLDEEVVL
jgi:hypothetical protein